MPTFCRTQAGLDTSVALLELSLSESQGVNVMAEALCPAGPFRTQFPKGEPLAVPTSRAAEPRDRIRLSASWAQRGRAQEGQ